MMRSCIPVCGLVVLSLGHALNAQQPSLTAPRRLPTLDARPLAPTGQGISLRRPEPLNAPATAVPSPGERTDRYVTPAFYKTPVREGRVRWVRAQNEDTADRLPDLPEVDPRVAPVIPMQAAGEVILFAGLPEEIQTPTADGGEALELLPEITVPLGEGIFFFPESAVRPTRFFIGADYLLWWTKPGNVPPLVTTSPATVPEAERGRLGPNTTVLFGGGRLDSDVHSGVRVYGAWWFGSCPCWGVDGSFFTLGQRTTRFQADSSTFPVLARPIQIQNLGNIEGRQIVVTPGLLAGDLLSLRGGILVEASTRFWGAEANLRRILCLGCNYRVDALAGYRFLELDEGLTITEDIVSLRDFPAPIPVRAGDRIIVQDSFGTLNQFHGGQVGASAEFRRGRWVVVGTAKIALGVVHQTIDINGFTSITTGGGGQIFVPAGLLAVASNSGRFTRDRFAVAPEIGIKLGYQLTERLRVHVGYDFLYLSNVVRPGDQIDRSIDVNQVPFFSNVPLPAPAGASRPLVPFATTDFWAQGLNFGMEFRW